MNKDKTAKVQNLGTQCGQSFVTQLLEFQFHCCFCTDIFCNYDFFKNHILQTHQHFKNNINVNDITKPIGSTKFGEIYISSLKNFTLECAFCNTNLENFETFFEHTCCCQLQHEEDDDNLQIKECNNSEMIKNDPMNNADDDDDDDEQIQPEVFIIKETNESALVKTPLEYKIIEKIPGLEKPFVCLVCPSAFKRRFHLIEHNRIHTGEKPFICEYCDKGFTQKNKLTIHIRRHTGIKPFKCSFCEKPFVEKRAMLFHEGSHTGEKPFKCSYCEVAFRRKYVLVIHERQHTGERPFECNYCPKNFTNRRACTNHERKIHKIEEILTEIKLDSYL